MKNKFNKSEPEKVTKDVKREDLPPVDPPKPAVPNTPVEKDVAKRRGMDE